MLRASRLCSFVSVATRPRARSPPAWSPGLKRREVRGHAASQAARLRAPRLSRRSRLRHALLTRAERSFVLGSNAMLRAGCAPFGFRSARAGRDGVERRVANSLDAPARAGRLQPPLGFRCALRRCSLRVPVPHLALRPRHESLSSVSHRVRSQAKRAAEVRLALCLTVLSSHVGLWCCRCRRLAHPSLCG